ncbi:MAG: ribosomal-processing cysteine protease Prp [Candidatus Riflebacteria bacterium]|nr:ribosomal-processing cysteine protease Prp [Candidatus Riflebacteria bacterium]
MIVVDFPGAQNCRASLRVTGHSGMSDKGSDIVCAAISALVQTFAGGVETSMNAKVLGDLETGGCNLTVMVPENFGRKLEIVCEVFKFGFRKIAESYPEHVQLN